MLILGIETSCDETAAAVVESGNKILSSVVASSAEMHRATGGIVPEKAARQQILSIVPVVQAALKQAWEVRRSKMEARKGSLNLDKKSNIQDPASNFQHLSSNVDAIAVTSGPGLIGSLLVGIETAKTLALLWKKPLVPVNHLVAHIYANWLAENPKHSAFPALALVVSGGHTDLVLMHNHGKLEWVGGTRDDAAGEAFDKCARLLGLPYPGGPTISAAADKYLNQSPITYLRRQAHHPSLNLFPRPMLDDDSFDWSFSGLKTAVLREVKSNPTSLKLRRAELAAQVQEAIVDVLVEKTLRAVKKFKPRSLLLAGGVAANLRLREKFQLTINRQSLAVDFRFPPVNLCTDNAAYIAACAYYNYSPTPWKKIVARPELTISNRELS